MSPLLKGRAKIAVATQEIVRAQAEALDAALAAGGDQLDADDVAAARQIIAKVGQRNALAGDHTVVALAGATGSGKSSLFNAIAGQELAQVGATRPTTSTPSAAVWGDDPAGPLLDWLAVPRRHAVSAPSGEPTDEQRPGHSTASCCSTCPTSTPGRCRTGRRPSACWRSATCSSG